MKELKPITLDFDGGEMKLIGRAGKNLPYISISMEGKNGYKGCVPDKAVKRLRRWCDEILKPRRES